MSEPTARDSCESRLPTSATGQRYNLPRRLHGRVSLSGGGSPYVRTRTDMFMCVCINKNININK